MKLKKKGNILLFSRTLSTKEWCKLSVQLYYSRFPSEPFGFPFADEWSVCGQWCIVLTVNTSRSIGRFFPSYLCCKPVVPSFKVLEECFLQATMGGSMARVLMDETSVKPPHFYRSLER